MEISSKPHIPGAFYNHQSRGKEPLVPMKGGWTFWTCQGGSSLKICKSVMYVMERGLPPWQPGVNWKVIHGKIIIISSSSNSKFLSVTLLLFQSLKYNYINAPNYLEFHTLSVWRCYLHALLCFLYLMLTVFPNFALPFRKLSAFVCQI
jgi:hypothetical protein